MINGKFWDKLIEKWPVKVLSVAAALVISVFYRMNTLETRFITVPLHLEANEHLIPTNFVSRNVRVSLRGEPNSINPILEEDIEAFIDLNRYSSEGTFRIPVQIRRSGSALRIEPLEITVVPTEVPLTLEQKVTRDIPIIPVLSGTVARGFELTSHIFFPENILAEGPRSSLENLYEFITETIDIDERSSNFSVLVNIVNDNPLITIHGNRMIEYRGTINRIERGPQRFFTVPFIEDGEDSQ